MERKFQNQPKPIDGLRQTSFMDHTDHKKISRSTKASTVLAIPFIDHTDRKKKISRLTEASTVLAIPFMDHTDHKKKISRPTKASTIHHADKKESKIFLVYEEIQRDQMQRHV
jgi:hypothetical protein